jgi:dihydroxy-acid dehydratase
MVRISDGRMSGTGFGTVVLHATPEAACGGNFSIIQNGDLISLDVYNRSLQVELTNEEIARRKKNRKPFVHGMNRGYTSLYVKHVQQANLGADMDFLQGASGPDVTRDSH